MNLSNMLDILNIENSINTEIMRNIIIDSILVPSIQKLYRMDYDNIRFGVSERNICARLAHHMENIMREYDNVNGTNVFRNYYVDVEYNRMGNGDIKYYENSERRPRKMVSDLLIQSRGLPCNYLAIEMKRKENKDKDSIKTDRDRLRSLVTPSSNDTSPNCVHDTKVGAFITYSRKDIVIDIYEANDDDKYSETIKFETLEQRIDSPHRYADLKLISRSRLE